MTFDITAWWVKPVAYVLGAALIIGGLAWYRHSLIQQGWDERDKDFQAFKAEVNAKGAAANARAVAQAELDKRRKDNADKEHAQTVAALDVALRGLRVQSDSRSFTVPTAPAGANRPDLACFDRAELERASRENLKRLRTGIRAVADEGTACTVDLNTAKHWEQQQ